jgi:cellobiose phosphorylase
VRKPQGGRGRVSHLVVDGRRVEGTLVPLAPPGSIVRVEAVVEGGAELRPAGRLAIAPSEP